MCVLTLLLVFPEGIANSSLSNFKIKASPKVPKEWKKTFCKMFHNFFFISYGQLKHRFSVFISKSCTAQCIADT